MPLTQPRVDYYELGVHENPRRCIPKLHHGDPQVVDARTVTPLVLRRQMTPVANIVFSLGIFCLFWLDRDPKSRTSRALWIPMVWLSIAGSRSVSQWLQIPSMSPSLDPEGNPLDQFVAAALIAFGISVLVRRGPKVRALLRANRPIVLFFLYCALSIVWSEYPVATVTRWVKALGDLLMILIVITDPAPID